MTEQTAFDRWASGLDWGKEETLIEQRDRILREVLPHIWQKQQESSKDVTKSVGQLTLFC